MLLILNPRLFSAMSFFNLEEPILRRKQTDLDVQDLEGLLA